MKMLNAIKLNTIKQYVQFFGFACVILVLAVLLFRSNQNRKAVEKQLIELHEKQVKTIKDAMSLLVHENDSLRSSIMEYSDTLRILKHSEDSLQTKIDLLRSERIDKVKLNEQQTVAEQYQNVLNYIESIN